MTHLAALSLLFILLISGCTNINVYKNPLTELSESTTKTRIAIASISDEANKSKINNLASKAVTESQRFGENDLTELVPAKFVKARIYGLELIERLATRLLQVIDLERDSIVTAGIENVGEKAKTLATQLGNTSLAGYAGPVSSLASVVVNIYDQEKRERILTEGVNAGIPQAQIIIERLKADFTPQSATNIQSALLEELQQNVTEQIHQYDLILDNQKVLSDSEKMSAQNYAARFDAVRKIIIAQEAVNAMNSQAVIEALDDLSSALASLREVVISDQSVENFSIFVSQVVIFSKRSSELLDAVHAIRNAGQSASISSI